MNEWISTKDRLPSNEELQKSECWDFLCRVLIPEKGGGCSKSSIVLKYDRLDEKWVCSDVIVTHWMPLPKPPND